MTWRRSGQLIDVPDAGGFRGDGLPAWMGPLLDVIPSITTDQVTRFAPVDGRGRHAAVLILFSGNRDIVLIERAHGDAVHSGQPAFPGGAVEAFDADVQAAALREANEEIGIASADVRIVGLLPDLWVPVSDFVVSPVLAFADARVAIGVQDSAEVRRVERVPVDSLVDPENRFTAVHPSGYRGPAFEVQQMLVWGFTAGVIDALLDKSGWSTPWDRSREVRIDR